MECGPLAGVAFIGLSEEQVSVFLVVGLQEEWDASSHANRDVRLRLEQKARFLRVLEMGTGNVCNVLPVRVGGGLVVAICVVKGKSKLEST